LFVPYKYVCCDSIVRPYRFKYPRQIRELKRCLWRDPCNAFMPSTIRILLKSKECKVALHDYDLRMEKNVIDAGNSGKFFKYVNAKLGRSHTVGILQDSHGVNVTTDKDKANLLNSFFLVQLILVITMYCPNFHRELVMMLNWTMFTSHQMHVKELNPSSHLVPTDIHRS